MVPEATNMNLTDSTTRAAYFLYSDLCEFFADAIKLLMVRVT